MDKILVAVFDTERSAFEGVTALKELHRDGDVTVYATAVIAKDASGNAVVRQSAEAGPLGTLVGLVSGSVIGLLGGPVGVAVGAYVGGVGGLFYDLAKSGVDIEFVDEVSTALAPGKAAVVADIDEAWITPVDARLGALGATMYRRVPSELDEEEWTREVKAARAEFDAIRAEWKQAGQNAKDSLEARMEAADRKLTSIEDRITDTIGRQRDELEAKLATLRSQWESANQQRRTELEGRMTELRADYDLRRQKLEQARELSRQAHELRKEAVLP